jgi:hypothetical protein
VTKCLGHPPTMLFSFVHQNGMVDLGFMFCLFRRKMIFIVKYLQPNYFSEKMIFSKIFFGVWLARKNH